MAAQAAFTSRTDYLAQEAQATTRHEYIDGVIYAMSGASRNHLELTRSFTIEAGNALRGKPCRNLDQDTKVWIERANAYYYPDATIACPPHFVDSANGVIDNPTVIVEVLSPSTWRMDRGQKFAHYRKLDSLREYALIDSDAARVEVFSLEGDQWVVRFYEGLDATARFGSVGIELPLSELYRHVQFEAAE